MNYCRTRAVLTIVNQLKAINMRNWIQSSAVHPETQSESYAPVMMDEVVETLNLKAGSVMIDMTFGMGGHSIALLKSTPGLKIFALDRDPAAHKLALELERKHPGQVIPLLGKFSDLPQLLKLYNITENNIDAFLFDLGTSVMQINDARRGFSWENNGLLDMRMDALRFPEQVTASEVLIHGSEDDLERIFKIYGDEKQYKKIARIIVESRYQFNPLKTTQHLTSLIQANYETYDKKNALIRKVFRALRMFVNNEVNELDYGIKLAHKYLKHNGRIAVISYSIIEDTVTKRNLMNNTLENPGRMPMEYCDPNRLLKKTDIEGFLGKNWHMLSKNVSTLTEEVQKNNFQSKSARLRGAIKIQ